jgi:hypothetical protein
MNDVYGHELRLWMNVFQPSVKLVRKVRVGARLRRVYEATQTPLQRVQASGEREAEALARLQIQQASLDPFELHRRIEEQLGAVLRLGAPQAESLGELASPPVPHPVKPERQRYSHRRGSRAQNASRMPLVLSDMEERYMLSSGDEQTGCRSKTNPRGC